MKLICLNAWGGKLADALLDYVKAEAPDVLCLQEITHTPASDKDRLTYRDGPHSLPQSANVFRDLCHALPDHAAFFHPAAQGELWDHTAAVPSQFGLATFVHRSLPVLGQVHGFVHKCYSADGYGDHPRPRNAHGVRVRDDVTGRSIGITHMHGLRDPKGKMDTPERTAQARRLLRLSDKLARPGDLRIICGDFNVEPDSETLQILADGGFRELVTTGGFAGTRSSHYQKPGRFADYMLVDQPELITDFRVIYDPEISDHCPLLLRT
ncbi:endonuclease/exonuclease/phosphatase family protein [Paracoccus laeviglucosivorans]|uniref:Metal-dependent hydrolase, endonuclease/exonuclease/phosphatase family n=1 Tax=Paracoccus laeviglucosivorans TaxID=1197861 RepID=A0A521DL40_9RHOB|nr:endonuclease/exonuclease/phosphatase family protein [Paracoccus laeviglucosivorans]SMO72443.1 Metal-dependent hydrolase, endonuclease/exonuclease/phosphatase family [Paracoccus laeviglucosivorans]